MSGLHTVPDAAEDQQLLLDVRALLERSQRQAAKNRALEAHREKVEATLGRVQEALGTKMPRHDGFEELDGDHELSAALRAAARDSAALDARVEDAAALPEESRAALGEMHGALRSLRALALLLPLFYAGYAGIAAGACAALGVPFESAAAIFGHFDFGPAGLVDLLDGAAAAAAGGDASELARVAAARWLAAVAAFVVLGPPLLCVVVRLDVARPPPLGRGARRRCCGGCRLRLGPPLHDPADAAVSLMVIHLGLTTVITRAFPENWVWWATILAALAAEATLARLYLLCAYRRAG